MHETSKDLIISSQQNETHIALLEDQKLVEIHHEKSTDQLAVGDIFLGKIKKIMPGLNAAFVDIGCEKEAFIHFLDLATQTPTLNEFVSKVREGGKGDIGQVTFQPSLEKAGKIGSVLSSGQPLLVQVTKEPINTKGARVTTEISLAGRYLVLVPFFDKVSMSQKIKGSEERKRLRKIVQGIKPKHFGIIIRTNAAGTEMEDLTADLKQLISKWKGVVSKLRNASVPSKMASEMDKTFLLIRDMVDESFNTIYTDSPSLYQEIKEYFGQVFSGNKNIVKLYKDSTPIFEHFNIAKQIKGSFGKIVSIKSGIYLIIEQTEAMHVIDVNSGNKLNANQSEEQNAIEVNIEAAIEIARQIRLRNLGGIIIIDFIDMDLAANRTLLYNKMKELMAADKTRHTILPLSKFGLMQITRQRVQQANVFDTAEQCPTCQGTGKIKPSILFEEEIVNLIEFLFQKNNAKRLTIHLHPYLYAYFTKGLISKRLKWFFTYHKWVRLEPHQELQLLEYKFFNQDMEEIVLVTPHSEHGL